jgi:hypothetical protein
MLATRFMGASPAQGPYGILDRVHVHDLKRLPYRNDLAKINRKKTGRPRRGEGVLDYVVECRFGSLLLGHVGRHGARSRCGITAKLVVPCGPESARAVAQWTVTVVAVVVGKGGRAGVGRDGGRGEDQRVVELEKAA